jgi:hypothetical protein
MSFNATFGNIGPLLCRPLRGSTFIFCLPTLPARWRSPQGGLNNFAPSVLYITARGNSSVRPLILLDFIRPASYDNKAKQHSRGGCATRDILRRNEILVAFCALWVATLCRCSQPGIGWDAMGLTGTNIGVGEGVRRNWVVARMGMIAEIERQRLTGTCPQNEQKRYSKRPQRCMKSEEQPENQAEGHRIADIARHCA